jgi:Endosomal/lysosomal potassium channel TMEM175
MNLLHSLLALWPSDLAFAVILMFIGQVRANHHFAFDHIRPADRVVVLLNAVLLMSWRSFRSLPPSLSRRWAADTANEPPRLALSPRSGGRVAAHRPVEDGGLRSHER